MSEKEPFRKIQKSLIDVPEWLPRKPENDKEGIDAMQGFSDNIKNTGLLNPITIKEKKNGRFDLIAGSRRLTAFGDDELWAKVENKSIDEFDARIKCGSENQQRVALPFLERDEFYYKTFELGKKKGKIKSIRDLAKLLGMSDHTLGRYIHAGEERAINKNDIIITSSNTEALNSTKSLIKMPDVRNILLEMNIDEVLGNKDLPVISKNIENCIKNGMTEKMVVQIIDMAKNNYSACDDNRKIISYDLDEKKLVDLTTVIMECKPDVRNYIVDKKISVEVAMKVNKFPEDVRRCVANSQISLEEAEEISTFEKVEERRQLIQERMKINKWSERSDNVLENVWDKNISIRKQQVNDIKNTGDSVLKTDFDIQHQRKLDLEADKAMYFDENTRRRYKRVYDDLVTTVATQHPNKIVKSEVKKDTTKLIIETYKLCRLLLLDLGVIKNMTDSGLDFIDANFSTKDDSNPNSNSNK